MNNSIEGFGLSVDFGQAQGATESLMAYCNPYTSYIHVI